MRVIPASSKQAVFPCLHIDLPYARSRLFSAIRHQGCSQNTQLQEVDLLGQFRLPGAVFGHGKLTLAENTKLLPRATTPEE